MTAAGRRQRKSGSGRPNGRRSRPSKRRAARPTSRLVVQVQRAYDPPAPRGGGRVLVDRVWPRGLTRERLNIAAWLPDLGPSTPLRKWFGHDPRRWGEFRRRYMKELAGQRALLDSLAARARRGRLTLVFGARDPVHNQAVVIKDVLERRGSR